MAAICQDEGIWKEVLTRDDQTDRNGYWPRWSHQGSFSSVVDTEETTTVFFRTSLHRETNDEVASES